MRIRIIEYLKANDSGDNIMPTLGTDARITYASDESMRDSVHVDSVRILENEEEPIFGIEEPQDGGWEITFTPTRITFWSAWVAGLFTNKAKLKQGISSAGQLRYDSIMEVWICDTLTDASLVSFRCIRSDLTINDIVIKADFGTLQQMIALIVARFEEYFQIKGLLGQAEPELAKLSLYSWQHDMAADQFLVAHVATDTLRLLPTGPWDEEEKFVEVSRRKGEPNDG